MITYIKTKDFARVISKIVNEIQALNRQNGTMYKVMVFSKGIEEFENVTFNKMEFIKDIKDDAEKVYIFRNYNPFDKDEIVHLAEKYILSNPKPRIRIYFVGDFVENLDGLENYIEVIEDYYPKIEEVPDRSMFIEGLTLAEMKRIKIFNLDKIIFREKILKKSNGILEIMKPTDIDIAIGLEEIIELIKKMKGKGKGTLLLGVPGTGKTLIAKNISKTDIVVRFSFASIYSKYVGESEKKLKETIQILEQFGDCFLFIDEFEKALATGIGDSGVSKRLLGEFLSWLEDRSRNQYIIATMNDLTYLPLELIRPGRWDFIFGLIPPPRQIRERIVEYYSQKYNVEKDNQLIEMKNITPADISNLYRIASVIGLEKGKRYVKFTKDLHPNFSDIINLVKKYSTLVWEEDETAGGWL